MLESVFLSLNLKHCENETKSETAIGKISSEDEYPAENRKME